MFTIYILLIFSEVGSAQSLAQEGTPGTKVDFQTP
jgi:hypothetical protein